MKTKKRGWIVPCLAALALLGACSQEPDKKSLLADDITKLNSAPQIEYPQLTPEQQKEIVRFLAEERRKKRIEGLREKVSPADWIQVAYHGQVLDANLDVIPLNPETVSKIQESMFSILQPPARTKAIQVYGSDLRELFNEQQVQGEEKLVVRGAVLEALINESTPELRARYEWRHRLLRGAVSTRANRDSILSPAVTNMLKQRGLREEFFDLPPASAQYVEMCRAQGVPIPPDWPDARWISQGIQNLVFITGNLEAEVFAFKDPSVPGVCYALPRRTANRSIEFLGIICQGEVTGKVCFWDNRTVDDDKIVGPDIQLDIDTIGNGLTLGETCTNCHRGDNVYNIHPGTPLQLNRAGAPGGPYDTSPQARYTPIGQAHWENPSTLDLGTPAGGQMSCTICHGLPQPSPDYCASVLIPAATLTMPPFGNTRAGWPNTSVAVNPMFADHIGRLSALCPP